MISVALLLQSKVGLQAHRYPPLWQARRLFGTKNLVLCINDSFTVGLNVYKNQRESGNDALLAHIVVKWKSSFKRSVIPLEWPLFHRENGQVNDFGAIPILPKSENRPWLLLSGHFYKIGNLSTTLETMLLFGRSLGSPRTKSENMRPLFFKFRS